MEDELKGLNLDLYCNRIDTSSKNYYFKQQKIFVDLFNKGLIYRKKSFVMWDPIEKTTLANEQVIDGKH